MRVINVVKIRNGVVDNIESFGVYEEQLVDDVVEAAEAEFIAQAKKLGFKGDEDDEATIIENGYYEAEIGEIASVCISWSYVDE